MRHEPWTRNATHVYFPGRAGWDDFLNGPIEDLSTLLKPGYKRGKWLRGPLSGERPNT